MKREEILNYLQMVYDGRKGIAKAVVEYMKERDSRVFLRTFDENTIVLRVENKRKDARDLNLPLSIIEPFVVCATYVKSGFELKLRFHDVVDCIAFTQANGIIVEKDPKVS